MNNAERLLTPLEFDCVKTPLRSGVYLLEASAGTGKTFALAMLVLRAVTENNSELERILVVTYTKAAAAELRERIRLRLLEARNLLEGREENYDQVLCEWFAGIETEELRKLYLGRLKIALAEIDRLAAFTIHGFCQRMLQEQSVEANQLFDVELLPSLAGYYKRCSEYFWRREVYPLETWKCSLILEKFSEPAALLKTSIKTTDRSIRLEPQPESMNRLWTRLEASIAALRDWWQKNGAEFVIRMKHCLENDLKASDREKSQKALEGLILFCEGKTENFPARLECLLAENLQGAINSRKIKKALQEQYIQELSLPKQELARLLQDHRNLLIAFQIFALQEIQKRVDFCLEEEGVISFDQLVTTLSDALRAENGSRLKALLQNRFEVALIDEFQDTDSAQWHIFSTLFASKNHKLYLIGDPRQAIYKFRGADIYSYFAACKKADYYFSLNTNYRSYPELVEGVNRLFLSRARPFLFEEQTVAYKRVEPGLDGTTYLADNKGTLLPSFIYCLPEPFRNSKGEIAAIKPNLVDRMVLQDVVQECLNLLDTENGALCCNESTGQVEKRLLAPGDIAILVRAHKQAEVYQKALVDYGIPAIIAGKKSIFETVESRELLLLLRGILDFENMQSIKSSMIGSLFGYSGEQIYQLWRDEAAVARWYDCFLECNRIWYDRGVLQMLYHLVEEKNLFTNLALLPGGQRRTANYLHLFELLQEAENEGNWGPCQTLFWLQNSLNSDEKDEAFELRLESDDDAVQIVTVHSSKGLQYPVVFCPDSYKRSARLKHEKEFISCFDDGNVLDFGSEKFAARKALARNEELAEELRLLYVALTRAELCCYCYWADTSATKHTDKSFESALGYLLFDSQNVSYAEQAERLRELGTVSTIADVDISGHYSSQLEYSEITLRKKSGRSLETDYQVSSYSALASLGEHDDLPHISKAESTEVLPNGLSAYAGLPKGAHFGNAVHDILEELTFQEIARGTESNMLGELVARKCAYYGVEADENLLVTMLSEVVRTPLSVTAADSFILAGLKEEHCVKEMEFYLHLEHFNISHINTILHNEPAVRLLAEKQLQGYMTGFVDLVCMHDGKYYVVDYKSNYLGDSLADYSADNLLYAMSSHNYGLQYFIYSLVLHQHLQAFVPDYDYGRHFGGVLYLFLRGMHRSFPGSGVFSTIPDEKLINQLDLLVREGREQ